MPSVVEVISRTEATELVSVPAVSSELPKIPSCVPDPSASCFHQKTKDTWKTLLLSYSLKSALTWTYESLIVSFTNQVDLLECRMIDSLEPGRNYLVLNFVAICLSKNCHCKFQIDVQVLNFWNKSLKCCFCR